MRKHGHQAIYANFVTPDTICDSEVIHITGISPDTMDLEMINYFKQKGIRVFVDMDDAVYHVEPYHPERQRNIYWSAKFQALLSQVFESVDGITVTTSRMAEYLKSKTKSPIFVVPNGIDEEVADSIHKPKERGARPVIGWAGGNFHVMDLEMLKPVFIQLLEMGYILRFIGAYPPSLAGYKDVEFIQWSQDIHSYYQSLALAKFDVCIAPLYDNTFNMYKSNIKLLEYAAFSGVRILASDIGPYRDTYKDFDSAFVVKSEPKHWVEWIEASVNIEGGVKTRFYTPDAYKLSHTGSKFYEAVKSA